MLATRHVQDPTTSGQKQGPASTMARAYDDSGRVREGFFNLTRRMESEEEEQFDVDHTILDFLVYKATAAVFEWHAGANRWESDLPNALITMAGEWRAIMSTRHRGRRLSGLAASRSRLLQFVLLLTHRYHPTQTWTSAESLAKLQQQNINRGNLWSNYHDTTAEHQCPAPSSDSIAMARRHRASALKLPSGLDPVDSAMFNTDRPSLYQLLPLFIELTAAQANLDDEWQPTSDWFDLAGQFMLQAVIDQDLVNGECTVPAFTSIFAFGEPGVECGDGEGSDVLAMRTLFCKDHPEGQELPEWTATRRRYIREANALHTLPNIEARHPYTKFEGSVLSFLQHLHESMVKPDLIQVEHGRINIDGKELSEKESREMIDRMRL